MGGTWGSPPPFSLTPPAATRSLTLCGVSHSRQSSSETNNGPTRAPPYPGVPPSGIPPPFVSQWQMLCDYHIQLFISRWSRTELLPVDDIKSRNPCFIRTVCSLALLSVSQPPDGTTGNTASFPSNGNTNGTTASQHDPHASRYTPSRYNATNGSTANGTGEPSKDFLE